MRMRWPGPCRIGQKDHLGARPLLLLALKLLDLSLQRLDTALFKLKFLFAAFLLGSTLARACTFGLQRLKILQITRQTLLGSTHLILGEHGVRQIKPPRVVSIPTG